MPIAPLCFFAAHLPAAPGMAEYDLTRYSSRMEMKTVTVCVHARINPDQPSCGAKGGQRIVEELRQAVRARGLGLTVQTFECLGQCAHGPNAKLSPHGEFWHGLQPGRLEPLLARLAEFAPPCSSE